MALVPSRELVSFLNLMMHYVNGEKIGTGQQWSVLLDGPQSDNGSPLYFNYVTD